MKRSMLFGVLAIFAVSAMSVQNLNAQNDVKVNKTTQAINEPKPKPQANQANSDESTAKKSSEINSNAQIQKDNSQEPMTRSMQEPQGSKNELKAEQKNKNKSLDRTNKNQRPKMKKANKGEKIKNNIKTDNKDPKENPSGTNPKMKKYDGEKIKNNAQVENKDSNEKPKTNNPKMTKNKGEKIQNNIQSGSIDSNKEIQYEDPHNKNKANAQGKLQKKDVPAKPNSVIGPKVKTEKQTNTNGKNEADK